MNSVNRDGVLREIQQNIDAARAVLAALNVTPQQIDAAAIGGPADYARILRETRRKVYIGRSGPARKL